MAGRSSRLMSWRKFTRSVVPPILLLAGVIVLRLTPCQHLIAHGDQVVSLIIQIKCSCRLHQTHREHMQRVHHVSPVMPGSFRQD
jgi:hypothetical protein